MSKNRLQFVHHSTPFNTRDDAMEYLSNLVDSDYRYNLEKSLIGEPLVVTYRDDNGELQLILAIGTTTTEEGVLAPYHIIDSAKLEKENEELRQLINELQEELQGKIDGIQEELDRTQEGAGLSADGSYIADSNATYISGATSLANADLILDSKIREVVGSNFQTLKINFDDEFQLWGVSGVSGSVEDNKIDIKLTTDNIAIGIHEGPLGHHDHSITEFINNTENALSGLQIELITTGLDSNVREAYELVDADGRKHGARINIYKDSSLYRVYLGHTDDRLTSPSDPTVIDGIGDTALCFIYQLEDGNYQLIPINVETFLEETEFEDGLTVNNHVVKVLKDPASEDFLSVSIDGVKVDGIQDAIDEAFESAVTAAKVSVEAKDSSVVVEENTPNVYSVNVNVKENEKVLSLGQDGLYTDIKLSALTASEIAALAGASNIKEAYKLVATDGSQLGDVVKIYKDSSIVEIYLGTSADTIDPQTGEITKVTGSSEIYQSLNYAYIKADGSYELVNINISDFIHQTEYGDGLDLDGNILKVKRDIDSEYFLTISEDGVKVEGIQNAIDNAKSDINESLQEEISRAQSAETELRNDLNSEIERATEKDNDLQSQIDTLGAESLKNLKINFDEEFQQWGVSGVSGNVQDNIANVKLTTDNIAIGVHEGPLGHHDHSITEFIGNTENALSGLQYDIEHAVSGIEQEIKDSISGLQIELVTTGLDSNVREAYELVDADGRKHGARINIYKDSSLYSVYLGHVDDRLTSPSDPTVIDGTGDAALCFIYQLESGDYQLIPINVETFLEETEFEDGLTVNNHVVKVLKDPTSEDFLSVSIDGVKVAGIQDAIDEAKGELEDKLQEEIDRAQSAETCIDAVIGATKVVDSEVRYYRHSQTNYLDDSDTVKSDTETFDTIIGKVNGIGFSSAHTIGDAVSELNSNIDEIESKRVVGDSAITVNTTDGTSLVQLKLNAEEKVLYQNADGLKSQISLELDEENENLVLCGISQSISEIRLSDILKPERERAQEAESSLSGSISNEINRASSAETYLQEEIDALSGTIIQEITTMLSGLQEELNSTQEELDRTQEGAGLSADGSYIVDSDASYISGATSLANADSMLDDRLHREIERATLADEQHNQAIISINEKIETLSGAVTSAFTAIEDLYTKIEHITSDFDGMVYESVKSILQGTYQQISVTPNNAEETLTIGFAEDAIFEIAPPYDELTPTSNTEPEEDPTF